MTRPTTPGAAARLRFGTDPRFSPLPLFAAVFLGASTLLRLALAIRVWGPAELGLADLPRILVAGALRDLLVCGWILLPLALYLTLAPARILRSLVHRVLMRVGLFATAFAVLFLVTLEWTFWTEFQCRLNFIAVDYLVYTQEVLGNIVESYPLPPLLTTQATIALALTWALRSPLSRTFPESGSEPGAGGSRLLAAAPIPMLAPLGLLLHSLPLDAAAANRYQHELSQDGLATLVSAFVDPILDYDTFYSTLPEGDVFRRARRIIGDAPVGFTSTDLEDITHEVRPDHAARRRNVVMVVVESLGADFLGCYGDDRGLTPELDALARGALVFDDLFATGCRTVRGLEALSLSVPPTPGMSILHREANEGLWSTGRVFRDLGYETKFLYGGYGYFDEMNHFFSTNGFDVVDRSDLSDDEIRFGNVWGVCDEDLFQRVLRECDSSFEAGKPFFSMVMTTSNHRPYTYPDVVEIPPGNGRDGAVQYTDHALGGLVKQARSRPWFDDTIFVIVADHCANSAGKRELNLRKHHIPLLVFGADVPSGHVARLGSQIDVPTTLLGLLGFEYRCRFYGRDLLGPGDGRALVGNYQTLGLYENGELVLLLPKKRVVAYHVEDDLELSPVQPEPELLRDTIAYYQSASTLFRRGGLAFRGIP